MPKRKRVSEPKIETSNNSNDESVTSKVKEEEMSTGTRTPTGTRSPKPPPSKRARLIKRSQMFAKQLSQKPDFTIICQDFRIDIHSMLLSCRSIVFDTMFSGPFMESIDREMQIDDCQPGDLIEFLKYFYPKLQPKLKLRRGNVAEILYLAEKYQVPEVKKMCENSIEKISHAERSVARAMPWLKIAFDYNMENLQKNIVLKISKTFPDFDRTPTYKTLRPELKLELMKYSKLVLKERMTMIRDMAYDESTARVSGFRSDTSNRSTSFRSRVISIQALFRGWDDGDTSDNLEPDEPGIDSDNAESDSASDAGEN